MITFAEQLLALRKARGLTQRRVAEICGVSTVTVWNWENGRATPWSADKVLATVARPTGKSPALAAPYRGGEPRPVGDSCRRLIDNIGE